MVNGIFPRISVFQYLILILAISLAGTVFSATLLLAFSKKTMHMITTMFLASVTLLLPVVIRILHLGGEIGLLPLVTGHAYMNAGTSWIVCQMIASVLSAGIAGFIILADKG